MHAEGRRQPRGPAVLAITAMVIILGATGSFLPVLTPVRAAASGGPALTSTPSSMLSDGQYVKVILAGFAASSGFVFRQCTAAPAAVDVDCTAVNTQVIGITDATGAGSTYLPVYAGNDTALRNSGGTGSIVCDAGHPCVIAAMQDVNDLSTAVFTQITFGPSPDACPPPGDNAILGSGSASAYRAVYAWQSAVCLPPSNLSVGYTVSNSADGVSNFLGGLTSFGVTGPLPAATVPAGAPAFRYAPLTTSAVVLAYRIYDRRGPQVTSLTLTPDLVAQIFLGQIPNWNANPAILTLNGGVQFPARISPFARAEHSAETYVFTSWLAATASSVWTAGAQEIFPQPPSGVTGVTGSGAVGRAIVDPTTDFFDQGNLGFMDSSTAAFYGLPTVQIKRSDGSVTAATPDTIRAAVAGTPANTDGTITPNYATTDPLSYPMPMPTYMMAPTDTITPERGAVLAGFLRYAVQTGQSALPPGYAALPANLVSESVQVARDIPVSSPGASPSPTPAAGSSVSSSSLPSSGMAMVDSAAGVSSMQPAVTSAIRAVAALPASHPSSCKPPCPSGAGVAAQPVAATSVASRPGLLLGAETAQWVVPVIVVMGLIGLTAGPGLQVFEGRRRRRTVVTLSPPAPGAQVAD